MNVLHGPFASAVSALMEVLSKIWDEVFSISFFGSGFTFGDLFLGALIVHLGFYFLNFFANNGNRHVDDSSEGVKY